MDVVAALCDDKVFTWYENDGLSPPSFLRHEVSDRPRRQPCHVRVADINGDGRNDIVGVAIVEGTIMWYRDLGILPIGFQAHILATDPDGFAIPPFGENGPLPGPAPGIRQIETGDLDGDGDLDLASASVDNNAINWYENSGGVVPSFEVHQVTTDLDGARTVTIADVDSDGDNDIIAGGWFDNEVVWFENDGLPEPQFTRHAVFSANFELASWRVHAVDLDLDGDTDIVNARARGDTDGFGMQLPAGQVDWYENLGGSPPTFTRHILTTFPDIIIGKSVYSADLDNDTDMDLISASFADDKVAWYENLGGSPPQFLQHDLTVDPDGPSTPINGVADFARSVWAADMDNDGDNDIVWIGRESGIIAWHENTLINPPVCYPDLVPPYGSVNAADLLQFRVLFDGGEQSVDLAEPFGVIDEADEEAFIVLAMECGGSCGPADLTVPFLTLDFSDIVVFLVAFSENDPIADFDQSGDINFSDVILFLEAFAAGCA